VSKHTPRPRSSLKASLAGVHKGPASNHRLEPIHQAIALPLCAVTINIHSKYIFEPIHQTIALPLVTVTINVHSNYVLEQIDDAESLG